MPETTQRPPFKLAGVATIKHLNVRKEGPEDEKILAVDLKLEFEGIDRGLCAYFDEALSLFLWRHETGGLIARNAYLQPVAYCNEIEGATVEIDGRAFHGCDVKKFAMNPRDGGVLDFTCSVSLYPTTYEVGDLSKLVQDGARVLIEGPPDLFATERRAATEVE